MNNYQVVEKIMMFCIKKHVMTLPIIQYILHSVKHFPLTISPKGGTATSREQRPTALLSSDSTVRAPPWAALQSYLPLALTNSHEVHHVLFPKILLLTRPLQRKKKADQEQLVRWSALDTPQGPSSSQPRPLHLPL